MDKIKGAAKSVSKGGWHPYGDHAIHRDSWKSDLKDMATGKKSDPYASARAHQSAPLTALKDPDSFGPPPKHSGVYGSNPSTPTSATRTQPPGGFGSPHRREEGETHRAEEEHAPSLPYRPDTTGIRTDHLPKPPARRDAAAPAPPPRHTGPASPPIPPRREQSAPEPVPALPPRMTEHPDEYTPPPPPTYTEATQPPQQDPAALNVGAVNRLSQAGVSVPGFGIGNHASSTHAQSPASQQAQVSELQQRFARMNAGSDGQASSPPNTTSASAAAAHKKPPPPPPPKKPGLGSGSRPGTADGSNAPPPLPYASKPRPT